MTINNLEGRLQNPRSINTIRVGVHISSGELLDDLAKQYYMEGIRVMRFQTPAYSYTEEELCKYLKTLLFLRVKQANRELDKLTQPYHSDMRHYVVPAFVHTLLTSIGIASDYDYGFDFYPKTSVEAVDLLSASEMLSVSQALRQQSFEGLKCVDTGVPLQEEGDLSFMATFNIQGEILGYKKDHPLFGFYASLFNHEIISDILNPSVLRIRYGATSDYRSLLPLAIER